MDNLGLISRKDVNCTWSMQWESERSDRNHFFYFSSGDCLFRFDKHHVTYCRAASTAFRDRMYIATFFTLFACTLGLSIFGLLHTCLTVHKWSTLQSIKQPSETRSSDAWLNTLSALTVLVFVYLWLRECVCESVCVRVFSFCVSLFEWAFEWISECDIQINRCINTTETRYRWMRATS